MVVEKQGFMVVESLVLIEEVPRSWCELLDRFTHETSTTHVHVVILLYTLHCSWDIAYIVLNMNALGGTFSYMNVS